MTDTDTVPATEAGAPLRPAWVWVIFLYNLFSIGLVAAMMWLAMTDRIPLNPAQKAALSSFSATEIAETVILSALSLAGAIQLFRLRRNAFQLLCTAFGASLLSTVWHTIQAPSSFNVTGHLVGWAVNIAICTYAWRLTHDGVLR